MKAQKRREAVEWWNSLKADGKERALSVTAHIIIGGSERETSSLTGSEIVTIFDWYKRNSL